MQNSNTPLVKELVLIGGGHAHVAVLRSFGMKPLPGLRITLITRDIHTPYSGMLPGYIAGHYTYDECHIDLGPLARFAGARLYHLEVEGLDLKNRKIHVAGRPSIGYDLLSINTGSRPGMANVPGAAQYALAAKPIDIFLERWEKLQRKILAGSGAFNLAVVGGGAGGVELALACQYRLQLLLKRQGDDPARLNITLLTQGEEILPTHSVGVRKRFMRVFEQRNIAIRFDHKVFEVTETHVLAEGKTALPANAVIWVTSASAPSWPGAAGLAVDSAGFIRVDSQLQSISHPGLFVVGDVAALPDPRPKSGVFAVRQGPVLSDNLRRAATGQPLTTYRPQGDFLGLISTGDRYAVASRGNLSLQGAWLWQLKNWIDQRFMRRFNQLPEKR